ncbi:MAG TPA: MauE/DoxX family redox-associated membrane protein [Pyrinomonadaceae bacterium]|nr:MauE/DoxX family redox-associated membrane protein [Pyrinomonadaceae bacterium]
MSLIIVLVRIALAVIFSVAGITKLVDQPGTREAVTNFGVPRPAAPVAALILPFIELAIAISLLVSATTAAGAIAALVLLGLFILAISINLARGQTHDCHCFGQLYSRPLGWPTLARNVVIALAAAFVLWQTSLGPRPNIVPTLAGLSTAGWAMLLAAVAILLAAFLNMQRKHRAALARRVGPEGLPIDTIAPDFELPAYSGGTKTLGQLLSPGKPLLLLFTNPFCGPCVSLFKEIREWQDTHNDKLTIALITRGSVKDNFVNVARNNLGEVLLQKEREVGEKYGGLATPTGVVVTAEGRIASRVAAGANEIRDLLTKFVGTNGNQA